MPDVSTKITLPLKYLSVQRTDLFLLAEFILLSACVLCSAYFQSDGFLSTDSTSYLALANSLLDTQDFYVSGYGYTGLDKDYFAIWPVAYPVLIALLAKLTGAGVFWSSKIINLLMAGICLLVFRKLFAGKAYIYGTLFLFGASIVIHSFSWSESVFISGLVAYAAAAAQLLSEHKRWLRYVCLLCALSSLLFLTRYIGAFSIICTLLLAIYLVTGKAHGNSTRALALVVAAGINIAVVMVYLQNNLALSQYLTGMPRIPAPESHLQLLGDLCLALLSALLIPVPHLFFRAEIFAVMAIQAICVLFFFRKNTGLKRRIVSPTKNLCVYSITFCTTGMVYLACIITLRWLTHFDTFYFKLVFPGMMLIFIAIMRHTEMYYPQQFQTLSRVLCTLAGFTVCMVPLVLFSLREQPTYYETRAAVEKEYAAIEPGSVVAFGSMHLKYLREDVLLWSPRSLPYDDTKETRQDFVGRTGHRKLYLAAPAELLNHDFDKSIYDDSVVELLREHEGKGVIQMR